MKTLTIIGFGRFGQTLYRLLKDDFDITIYKHKDGERALEAAYQSEIIFYAVPISVFGSTLKQHKKYISDNHILIDVLSVKEYPKQIFEKQLKGKNTQALLTHPMFGPDSSKSGFEGLPIILDKYKLSEENYKFWVNYFDTKKLQVIEISATDHDKLAAQSQGVTHFLGRVLQQYKFEETKIDSLGTKKLHEVEQQTCNDTWQLFKDLQQYNQYTKQMRVKIGDSYDKIYNLLLPKQKHKQYITIGIQGGKGSFNEEAIMQYIKDEKIKKFKIKYLYTSEKVLNSFHKGEIDLGQVAIHNSIGGIVGESIQAMAKYKFKIKKEFAIKISHSLMMRSDANLNEITTIMTHPQVLAQCKTNLEKKYPNLQKISGKGELVDHAQVAKLLAEEKLPKHIATMGSKILAKMYNLKIIEENLQDSKENWTSFLIIRR
jgi:prephenate dehydrogenase